MSKRVACHGGLEDVIEDAEEISKPAMETELEEGPARKKLKPEEIEELIRQGDRDMTRSVACTERIVATRVSHFCFWSCPGVHPCAPRARIREPMSNKCTQLEQRVCER